ncbi:DUF3054 domain-containing protein [Nocardiopsis mangrovi]|uniref:DUF3054 domain-containing protein n=1 Tax=Nocardiopsis mangrovi TaxID=1179818 RepID=A0ABV9DPC2_9ACTN
MRSVPVVPAALLDLLCVLVFVVVGRASHVEGITPAGVAGTAWPFVAALAIGWAVVRAWRAPGRIVPSGLVIWPVTVAAGMALRVAGGDGTQLSFTIVTTVFLGATLLGWRAVAALYLRRRERSGTPAT